MPRSYAAARKGKKRPTDETETTSPSKKPKPTFSANFSIRFEHGKNKRAGRKARALVESLQEVFGEIPVEYNLDAPRQGSFECTVVTDDGKEVLVWTGIDKGPPRALKFPASDLVIEEIKKLL